MALTQYKFYAGGFKASYKAAHAPSTVVDLGTTERGIKLSWDPSTVQIKESRTGEIIAAELVGGMANVRVTIESLNLYNTTTPNPDNLLQYLWYPANITGLESTGIPSALSDVVDYGYDESVIGASLYNFAGELTLEAVTGSQGTGTSGLVASTNGYKLVVHKCLCLENPNVFYSGRDVIRVPFTFRCFPLIASNVLKYMTKTAAA